jgi:chorismate lyase/3-hydroxybenzoate synthase
VPSVRPEIVPLDEIRRDDALAVIAFGTPAPGALLTIPIPQLGERPMVEVWRGEGVLIDALSCPDADPHRAATCVFDRMIARARDAGYPHLLRVWNHVRDINAVEDGLERYRSFCSGRHDAFARHGYTMRGDLPAASAVGMATGGVTTYFAASPTPARAIENPRQVPAYDYPPAYGPRSPSFSRATVGAGLVFVSGTASVVGHETKHPGDIAAQLEETLVNLHAILGAAGARELRVAKVYVRRPWDYPLIAARLEEAMPRTQKLFLRADICREDLLVEIDGVAV